ncbi:hypothetical protein BDV59DRAFT_195892 [Aspergillus ambiguus]|uniref:pseudouridine synthase PUS2 n=1 Tax=Aspergillus ambiguus TaxID=176160 RepID=UPI003CCCF605
MDNHGERAQERGEAGGKRKKRDLGRAEWSRQNLDKRARNDEEKEAKRRKIENGEEVPTPVYATHFSQEDIENEQRRPKKKVAVLLGYSGTGYKGMQLSDTEKTIEGELFTAFVAAGAISKANAADPKKSSLVRCARTDKGVHAAGNVVSLKLIVEDPDIVQKINEKLSPQIRVWDILLANKSFSAYQMCDSRIYEYLIPTYCFLPPHPSTYLGRKLPEIAEKHGDLEAFKARQEEVAGFWEEVDEKYIQPVLKDIPEDIRKLVEKALYIEQSDSPSDEGEVSGDKEKSSTSAAEDTTSAPAEGAANTEADEELRRRVIEAVKTVKAAYNKAKRAYRIPPSRLTRVQVALEKYVGTRNFWNYTIQKTFNDASAKRHIKSFKADTKPVIINGTEWLSLKVHGQSFMMHQIRKMVAMAALVVRCGCDPKRIEEAYGPTKIAIPKAPGLGLLLERPVFESYNKKGAMVNDRKPINFDEYTETMNEFKQREIYDRIFREEVETNAFTSFFNHIDHYSLEEFLYLTSGGIPAARPAQQDPSAAQGTKDESDKSNRRSQREALREVEQESEDETNPAEVTDPLRILPPEIVLRVLEFASVSTLASLTAVSKAWHNFIDVTHQDAIYSSDSKTTQPSGGAKDFSFLSDYSSFSNLFKDTESWKDLCKRQTLLARNWDSSHPVSRESVMQIGNDPVWRFRADFKRRIFVSTSHAGGLNVTDMDTGRVLWRLPSTLEGDDDNAVRPYAHLEYQDGMAVFDREGDAVEVWQADLDGAPRGEFRRIAVLNHDCQTRGFQLSYWTLCVVSNEEKGFVYDMTQRPPKLTAEIAIAPHAVGHLDQDQDAVIYSMGERGYHAYKKSGEFLGVLLPSHTKDIYHINPPADSSSSASRRGLAERLFPPGTSRQDCLTPIKVDKGPLPEPDDPEHVRNDNDEWGAGMLHGELFVGFSRAGRVFICPNWRKYYGSIIECESDGSSFDLGGWLSVRNHRIIFEIQDRVYVDVDNPTRACYSMLTSSAPQLAVPVSFMALYDDAIMTTYTTLGWRQPNPNGPRDDGPARIFPTKAIRIISLAPNFTKKSSSTSGEEDVWHSDPYRPRADDMQAGLLRLVSMLGEQFGEEEDEAEEENSVEIETVVAGLHADDIEGELEEEEHGYTNTNEHADGDT